MMGKFWSILLLAVALMHGAACTLVSPEAPPPTATLPDGIITPPAQASEQPQRSPTPTVADATCRAVNEGALTMRIAPNIEAAEVTVLAADTTTEVIGRTGSNGYWQVRTNRDVEGWIDASATTLYGSCTTVPIVGAPTLTPDVPTVSIKVNLNVRSGPSVRFKPPIGRFEPGETVEVVAVNPTGDWFQVRFGGGTGWISASSEFVELRSSTVNLPVDIGPPTPTATNTPIPSTPTATLDPNTNYLRDPGFEGDYLGREGFPDLTVPADWQVIYYEQPRTSDWQNLRPVAFPHINPPEVRSGEKSQNFNKDFATFTAVLYQQATVPANITVNASAWAWVHTCDPQPAICGSDSSSGARMRVGIDPNGGTNPQAEVVVWSQFITPHDSWGNVGTSAQANGGTVTVFLYATQDFPKGLNRAYWDDALLTVGG